MLLFIILLALTVTGILIFVKSYSYSNIEMLGMFIMAIFGTYLLFHILFWSLSSYNYNQTISKRNAFIETLEYARKNKNQFELASITREISEFNQNLASSKYDNSLFLLSDYVDDRIMYLKPIR